MNYVSFSTKMFSFQSENSKNYYKYRKKITLLLSSLLSTFIPGFRQPFRSAGPPGVMELIRAPRSWWPEFSPPTTWKPGEQNKHTLHFTTSYKLQKDKCPKIQRCLIETLVTCAYTKCISLISDGQPLIQAISEQATIWGGCKTAHSLSQSGIH